MESGPDSGTSGPLEGPGHRNVGAVVPIHRLLGRIPGIVRARKSDLNEERLVAVIVFQPLGREVAEPGVLIGVQRQRDGIGLPGPVGRRIGGGLAFVLLSGAQVVVVGVQQVPAFEEIGVLGVQEVGCFLADRLQHLGKAVAVELANSLIGVLHPRRNMAPEVGLSDHCRMVSGLLKRLRVCRHGIVDLGHVLEDTVIPHVAFGEEGCPRRHAERPLDIDVVELNALAGQPVRARRFGYGIARGAEHVRPLLVGHEENDVRFVGHFGGSPSD